MGACECSALLIQHNTTDAFFQDRDGTAARYLPGPSYSQCHGESNALLIKNTSDAFLQESDNEMVISDVDTGEFIAKKIIYD